MQKIALVTGASSGIGSAIAISLAKRGTDCIVTFNGNSSGIEQTVESVRHHGATAIPLKLDIRRTESFPQFRQDVLRTLQEHWKRDTFDGLVNNAGAAAMASFPDTTEAIFDQSVQLLFKGPYFLTQTLLPLIADGGSLLNISSSCASPWCTEEGYSVYASMKGALNVFTRCLAKELSSRGIRANTVAPGPTRTRLGGDAFDKYPEIIPSLVERTALGRLGEPDDIGDSVAALLSDDCRWVTGQDIEVSGGYRL